MTDDARYHGKPLLRLFELYVLWSIGELPSEMEKALTEMTPKLQAIYGTDGSWQQVIGSVMQAPSDLPAELQSLWHRNIDLARTRGETVSQCSSDTLRRLTTQQRKPDTGLFLFLRTF